MNDERIAEEYGPSSKEREFLRVLERDTGIRSRTIGLIDLNNKETMRVVLPIACSWIERTDDPRLRFSLKCLFRSKHARSRQSVEKLVSWLESEADETDAGILANILSLRLIASVALKTWGFLKGRLGRIDNSYRLAVRLLNSKSTHSDVKRTILAALDAGTLSLGEINDISESKDLEIQKRIRQLYPIDPVPNLPMGFAWVASHAEPDRREELASFEVDLDEVSALLGTLKSKYELVTSGEGEQSAQGVLLEKWYQSLIPGSGDSLFELWIRFEDVDVVEIVLVSSSRKSI